jgi:hypothetical protein
MEFDEMVDQDNVAEDDALLEDVVEEEGEPEESLESIDEEQPAEEPEKTDAQGTSEPGWIKKRVEKAVNKAVSEALAAQKAQFDEQMAPILEKMLEDEAKELLRQGEFKSLDRAKEYLKLKQGMPVQQEQPQEDPAIKARIEMLQHQANRIKANTGVDVIAEYQTNDEIKRKIQSGEMDFYDVAEYMKEKPKRKKVQAPVRSSNGAGGTKLNAIESMSDEQFDRLVKKVQGGARYSLR